MSRSRVTRVVVTVLATVLGLLGTALPAQAEITNITIHNTGEISGGGVFVGGTITCEADQGNWRLKVVVRQHDEQGNLTYKAIGTDRGVCTGDPEGWSDLAEDSGTPEEGDAKACVRARTVDDGIINDRERKCEGVGIFDE